MKLAIMLATALEIDTRTVVGLASAARELGHDVLVFLTGDAVRNAAAVAPLSGDGISLGGCAHSAKALSLPQVEGIAWGNQLDWAQAARDADRVIVLG